MWWQEKVGVTTSYEALASWHGDINARERIALREEIVQQGYTSILDAGCGLCVDYEGIRSSGITICYQGLDITPKFVDHATKRGIPVVLGSIESIPFEGNSFDIAYARHVLEHLEYYEAGLTELIRVAKKEVFVNFFSIPDVSERTELMMCEGIPLYHNYYNKMKMEQFLLKNPKVKSFRWTYDILQIYL